MRVQDSVAMKSELFLISNASSVSISHRSISFLTLRVNYLHTFFEFRLAVQIISSNMISYFRPHNSTLKNFFFFLTVHPGMILVNNQPDAQFFMYVYFYSLHVSGSLPHPHCRYATDSSSNLSMSQ